MLSERQWCLRRTGFLVPVWLAVLAVTLAAIEDARATGLLRRSGRSIALRTPAACSPCYGFSRPVPPNVPSAPASSPAEDDSRSTEPEPRPTLDQLMKACRKARDQFRPITQSVLQEARAHLAESVDRLDDRLKADKDHGNGWREYLQFDQLVELVERPGTLDPDQLDHFYSRLVAGHFGLELQCFVQLRRSLARYITLARAARYAELEQYYTSLLDTLEPQLAAPERVLSTEGLLLVADTVAQLEEIGQAETLIRLIRRYFSEANFHLVFSARLIGTALDRPIDERLPVYDVILGTELYGTAHTTGRMTSELVPRTDRAEIRTVLKVKVASRATGYNGPIRAFTVGTTEISTWKSLFLTPEGVFSAPAVSQAETESTIEGLCAVRGGRLAERIAWRRAAAQKQQADWIASRHAEQRMNRQLDDEFRGPLERLNRAYDERIRESLRLRGAWPERMRVWSTGRQVVAEGFQAGVVGMGAAEPPPESPAEADLVVSIHESLVNCSAADVLAGMLVDENRLLEAVKQLLGEVPERLRGEEGQPPWRIALARTRPVIVAFRGDQISFTFRGRQYRRGRETYAGMDITVRYKIEHDGTSLIARRVGSVEAFPPGFQPGQSQRLSARQQVLRTSLEGRLTKLFAEKLTLQPMELPPRWPTPGVLVPIGWRADRGWMMLAWRYEPSAVTAPRDAATSPPR